MCFSAEFVYVCVCVCVWYPKHHPPLETFKPVKKPRSLDILLQMLERKKDIISK